MQGLAPLSPACAPYDVRETNKPVFYQEVLTSGQRAGQNFSIKLAYDDQDLTSASNVINRLYSRRGYGSTHQVLARPDCVTFTAWCGGEMIGTLTLRVDSHAGLSADHTFPGTMANLRAGSRASLCELTKFAFDPSPDSRPMLAKLFHVIFVYGTLRFDCSDLVIEVNPRHSLFYEAMLGFSRLGELQTNELVQAPAQLMHMTVSQIGVQIARYAGGKTGASRSLYPHFLGEREEEALRERIAAGMLERQLPTSSRRDDANATAKIPRRSRAPQTRRAAA
jgi:hypothetical protein